MAATRTSWVVWLRRSVQTVFLALFFYLFLQAAYRPINRLGGRVTLFFDLDPLVMLVTWLGTHGIVPAMLLALVTLAVTMIFGRWFCGWICPFGTLHHLFSSLRRDGSDLRIKTGGYSRWQRSKYHLLAFLLGGALLGLNLAGWLDPTSFFFRSMATAVFPVLNLGVHKLFGGIYGANPGFGRVRLAVLTEPAYEFLRRAFLAVEQPHYFWSLFVGLLFVAVVALNLLRTRFWCRYVCPLGALLGAAGKNPALRLATDPAACDECRLCLADCQGGANPQGSPPWKPAECFYCWNCHSACPSGAITFRFEVPGRKKAVIRSGLRWLANFIHPPREEKLDLTRRALITSGAAGAGAGLLFGIHPLAGGKTYNPELIRPPGSVAEEEFLTRCIRCGECMKVCPTNAVQAALFEAGWAGMWSPVLKMRAGYCEYECTLCLQACPTDAIRELSVEEKQKIKIGLAYIDRDRCLPYALARSCIVCEEHCPTPKKAIWFEEADVLNIRGARMRVKQPHVDPDLCIGCGICETKCPVADRAAIIVTSVGETRNPKNQILLS